MKLFKLLLASAAVGRAAADFLVFQSTDSLGRTTRAACASSQWNCQCAVLGNGGRGVFSGNYLFGLCEWTRLVFQFESNVWVVYSGAEGQATLVATCCPYQLSLAACMDVFGSDVEVTSSLYCRSTYQNNPVCDDGP
jgi:hypothetical protein